MDQSFIISSSVSRQPSKLLSMDWRFMPIPMNTISVIRSPQVASHLSSNSGSCLKISSLSDSGYEAIHFPADCNTIEVPACDNNPAVSLRAESQKNPFARTISSGHCSSQFSYLSGWNGFLLLYTKEVMPYSSVSGICSSFNSLIQPAA